MKLASIDDGTRDGRLVVVSRDLTRCSDARHVARTLQGALDDWDRLSPQLELIARGIETGGQPVQRFHEREALAPLPRAYGFVGGLAYAGAGGADLTATLRREPLVFHCASDGFLAPRGPVAVADSDWEIDLEAGVAVITGDVPRGADRATALAAIRLVTLVNAIGLRALIPEEHANGLGRFRSAPGTSVAPVAVAPGALGAAWDGARLHGALLVEVNGRPLGRADAGTDMAFDFGDLIVAAARTRPLAAGTIIGSGAVSNRGPDGAAGSSIEAGGRGFSCLTEARMVEKLEGSDLRTPYLGFGDEIRIEMRDAGGHSIFGAIEQRVVQA